ncbi:MAG: HNH endonuclease [Lachnospiraceae bacterium]|nr:HNH endonuclease [Lachnospiraceae bacterium]
MYISREKENVYGLVDEGTIFRNNQAREKGSVSNRIFPKDIRVIYNQSDRLVLQCQQMQDVRISKVIQKSDDEFIPNWAKMQEELIKDAEDTEAFIHNYWKNSSEQIPENLILQITDAVCYGGYIDRSKVWITMTGSREGDKREAYRQLRVEGRPIKAEETSGYVWHHIPNSGIDHGSNECGMVLVEENHHNTPHIGAVKQYERYNRTSYS